MEKKTFICDNCGYWSSNVANFHFKKDMTACVDCATLIPSRNSENQEEPRTCLCENYSELKSVAEEMAEELAMLSTALEIQTIMVKDKGVNLKIISKELKQLGKNAKSALDKFNKLKEK